MIHIFQKKKTKKKVAAGDILKRGMSLVKSYSQMSEDERKELIKKAFEAKQKLQKELEETKDKMKEKDKELQKLQDEVWVDIYFSHIHRITCIHTICPE